MKIASTHAVRTFVVSSALILALLNLAGAKQITEWDAFRNSLPSEAFSKFSEKNIFEQAWFMKTAKAAKATPAAIELYFEELGRLQDFPLEKALRISTLAHESGARGFVLDYVVRFGANDTAMSALLDSSPEAIRFYYQQTALPDSPLLKFSVPDGLRLSTLTAVYGINSIKEPVARVPMFD